MVIYFKISLYALVKMLFAADFGVLSPRATAEENTTRAKGDRNKTT